MHNRPGSILGGTLLVAGSCIGAGMLGLPIVTGLCGFKLSLIIFFISWAFMTATGLILVEINGWFTGNVDLSSMIYNSLGRTFKQLSWLLYLFLFYSLLVAYFAGLGAVTIGISSRLPWQPQAWQGSLIFAVVISILLYVSFKRGLGIIDVCNRIFMFGKISAYLAIVALGAGYVQKNLLLHTDANYILLSLPIMVISFGFHNLIPTITQYMKGDLARVKVSVIYGSILALIVYLVWDFVILGVLPIEGVNGLAHSLNEGKDAAQAIARVLHNSSISQFADGLAFFALLTALMIQSVALTHFINDACKQRLGNIVLIAVTIIPPLAFSMYNPKIFFKALDFAGGICAVILFGIFPVLMVWRGRYQKQFVSDKYKLAGGKISLLLILGFAIFIMLFQLKTMFS